MVFSGGCVMSAYDPETLDILRAAIDQAWALLPEDHKNKFLKIDMADRVLRKAAMGERDPVRLRTSALEGTNALPNLQA
jgi:hypothetical protein